MPIRHLNFERRSRAEDRRPKAVTMSPYDRLPRREPFVFWIWAFRCWVRALGTGFPGRLGILVLSLSCLLSARSAETNRLPVPVVFHVGLAKVCFRNVNRKDAGAAYGAFVETSARRSGRVYRADPQVYDDTLTFEAAIQQEPMHMAVMEAWQFLTMDLQGKMKPFFAIMESGKVGRKYLLLTRRDSGLKTLSDLRGKAILELEVASSNVGKAWLDTLLLSERLGTQETFFAGVEIVAKPTAAVLPVFFGKKPACVVDEQTFEVMTELNPQVGQVLQAIAVSDRLADAVICLAEEGWPSEEDKSEVIRSLNGAHLDTIGHQICTLFKIDRMVPFEDAQLDTIRTLRATYELLRKETPP